MKAPQTQQKTPNGIPMAKFIGRPPLSQNLKRTVIITFRANPVLARKIADKAERTERTVADWIHRTLEAVLK